jgi:hypothetical protein
MLWPITSTPGTYGTGANGFVIGNWDEAEGVKE